MNLINVHVLLGNQHAPALKSKTKYESLTWEIAYNYIFKN